MLETEIIAAGINGLHRKDASIAALLKRYGLEGYQRSLALTLAMLDTPAIRDQTGQKPAVEAEGTDLNSVLTGGKAGARRVVAFNFTKTFKEVLLPLSVLTATLSAGSPTFSNLTEAALALKALWSNLIVLKQPDDDHAIRTVQAIGGLTLAARLAYVTPEEPSTAAIATDTGLTAIEAAQALESLCKSGVVVNVAWGNQSGDFQSPSSLWKLSI
jgi:hypothetical protein